MRHITLLLMDGTKKDVGFIKGYCKENSLEFCFECTKDDAYGTSSFNEDNIENLYYFSITGKTKNYMELKEKLGNKLMTTRFADLSNIFDGEDDEFENSYKDLYMTLEENCKKENAANKKLINFIDEIKNVEVLKGMQTLACYMTDWQKKILSVKIDCMQGNSKDVQEQEIDNILSTNLDIKELRTKTGMNRRQFASYFEIPYRTVEDWENHKSTCSTYLYKLMKEKLELNNLVK